MDWQGKTNEDVLAAWDAGETIWTCSMGGMSQGYEQCIHLIGMEMLRAMLATPFNFDDFEGRPDEEKGTLWGDYLKQIESTPAAAAEIDRLGPTGAQLGAAMNIAGVFARHGYEKGMDMVPADRRIQIAKGLPA